MTSSLPRCPAEIIHLIIESLTLRCICNLRQTCRELASKATNDTFKSYFRQRRVLLTPDSLRRFVDSTEPGQLGRLLCKLTVIGVVINTKELEAKLSPSKRFDEKTRHDATRHLDILTQRQLINEDLHNSGSDVALLSEAFDNLAALDKSFKLSLSVIIYRSDSDQKLSPAEGGGWKLIWQSTAQTFHTVLQALHASRAKVETFDIYRDDERCSIACNDINPSHGGPLNIPLPSIKSLSLSFSDRDIRMTRKVTQNTGDPADVIDWEAEDEERDLGEIQAEVESESNFTGPADMLKSCPNLTSLELHHYRLGCPAERRGLWLQRIVSTASLSHLQNLTLRGLFAREEDLLALIKRNQLLTLSLENVFITYGSFNSIFKYCTSSSSQIQKLHFDNLYEGSLVQFDGPGTPKCHPLYSQGSNTLDRSGEEVKRAITYHLFQGHVAGSPELYLRRQQYRKAYGPP